MHYILQGREVIPADLLTWGRWLQENQAARIVKQEDVGEFWVSTVFLGLDHQWGDGPPLVFETMVFKRDADGTINYAEQWMERCSTWAEAEAQHERAVVEACMVLV